MHRGQRHKMDTACCALALLSLAAPAWAEPATAQGEVVELHTDAAHGKAMEAIGIGSHERQGGVFPSCALSRVSGA
jgi:hypothetical protein